MNKRQNEHKILRGRETGSFERADDVRAMYELAPYPDLGSGLKDPIQAFSTILEELNARDRISYLEAGCGTGHLLVGAAKKFPGWRCFGIDLSQSSLDVAGELAEKHGASVSLHRVSYLDPLPFEKESFDLISAQGTLHHCDDPTAALHNLSLYLKPDGFVSVHVYGARLDSAKFDLKEALSLFIPNLSHHEERFEVYRAIQKHRTARDRIRAVLDISPLDIINGLRRRLYNFRRRRAGTAWSPPWTDRYDEPDAPWVDHFCHPCERAYEVPEFRDFVEKAGFRVVHMLGQGRVDYNRVPSELRERFDKLSDWDKWRFMELVAPPNSFVAVLKKK